MTVLRMGLISYVVLILYVRAKGVEIEIKTFDILSEGFVTLNLKHEIFLRL